MAMNAPSGNSAVRNRALLLKRVFHRVTGSPIKTDLQDYCKIVERIKAFDFRTHTDAQLCGRARAAGTELERHGPPHPTVLHNSAAAEIFALVREAARRVLDLDPFDAQMIAGLAMACGAIAELPTGEGKTLAAVFPGCLQALSGRGVHVLTFNDYLARRDAAWMGPIYRMLGLTVGCIQEAAGPEQKRAGYRCDVAYASAKEAGFDFLRDQVAYDRLERVQRPYDFAIVDEADSILIDEARIPLVISGAADGASWNTAGIAGTVKDLVCGRDFETDPEKRNVFLTDAGIERAESALACGSLYDAGNRPLLEALYCALHAEALLRRDVDYIVRSGRIEIVDEYTGRVVDKRHWPDGLQAAVEAKEGLARKTEGRILGSITLQHFFRLYPTLSGMTATAQSAADELREFYDLEVVVIPPHAPSVRVDHPDAVFTDRMAKHRAIVGEIREVHDSGRPVLVGTASIRESEELAADLRRTGVRCAVLNAKNDELEASIISRAGTLGAVTISTNMAGRGVDIKLGGDDEKERQAIVALGGLYVIGTNRHESLRIDRQLRGRAGRQGDPGATRFFLSLEDDLFERYGLTRAFMRRHGSHAKEGAFAHGPLQNDIAHAQRVIEGQNFDIRRSLYRFSSLVDLQRQIVQARRERVLLGAAEDSSGKPAGELMRDESEWPVPLARCASDLFQEGLRRLGPEMMAQLERSATLFHLDRLWSDHLAWVQDTRDSIHLVNLGGREPIDEFRKWATDEFLRFPSRLTEAVVGEITSIIGRNGRADAELERLKGPSSTWTYLVNEDQFGWGIETSKWKNAGFAYAALLLSGPLNGPLYFLALLVNRLSRSRRNR